MFNEFFFNNFFDFDFWNGGKFHIILNWFETPLVGLAKY
jgi:hypothetical protein